MSESAKKNMVDEAVSSAKFFEVEITIRLFGHVIFHRVIPKSDNNED